MFGKVKQLFTLLKLWGKREEYMEDAKYLAGKRKVWMTMLTEVLMTAVCFAAGVVGLPESVLKMLVENLPWALGIGVAGNAFEHGASLGKAMIAARAEAKKNGTTNGGGQ